MIFLKATLLFFINLIVFSATAQELNSADKDVARIIQKNRIELYEKNKFFFEELYSQYENIIGIELIVAGPIDQRIESRFGHTLLRFVSNSGNPINDKVLSFAANIEGAISYRKGIMGGYSVIAQLETFGTFIKNYIENEERPLSRYVIPTNKNLRFNLMRTLARWVNFPEQMGSYKFFSNNCAGIFLSFLEQSGFPSAFRISVPSMLPFLLADRYITPYEGITIPTLTSVFNSLASVLKIPANDLRLAKWPLQAIPHLKNLPKETVLQLWYKSAPAEGEVREQFKAIVLEKKNMQLNQVYGIKNLPNEMYELCENKVCVEKIKTKIKEENIYNNKPGFLKTISEYSRVKLNNSIPWLSDAQKKFVIHSLYLQSQ